MIKDHMNQVLQYKHKRNEIQTRCFSYTYYDDKFIMIRLSKYFINEYDKNTLLKKIDFFAFLQFNLTPDLCVELITD